VADFGNSCIRKVTGAGVVTTLAGSAAQSGSNDVTGSAARFNYPYGIAIDGPGNVYVADTDNSTVRKVTINGVVTTLAGSAGQIGSVDGTNNTARFSSPSGLAVDSAGDLYVADSGNDVIREITVNGIVTTLAGSAGQAGSVDGTNGTARFNYPTGVAVDKAENLFVADCGNNTIREVSRCGVVTTLAGSAGQSGSANGTNDTARFSQPTGVAVDSADNLYVADYGNRTIREVSSNGVVTTLAGSPGQSGSVDGTNSTARFASPFGLAVDGAGNVYVADSFNSNIRMIAAGGVVTTVAGSAEQYGSADGEGSAARFFAPADVAAGNGGNLAVADTGNSTIRRLTVGGLVTTLAGSADQSGSADDTGSAARYFGPYGVAVDGPGNVYVADTGNSTIRKVTSDGGVATLAGSAGQTGSADGTNSLALFNHPSGVAVDGAGSVYVADTYNSTIRIISTNGVVTTLAGTPGQFGRSDGMNGAAMFNYPSGVAVDFAGNLYVADSGNDTIRKVTSDGSVTTLAGSAGQLGSADGTGSAARFNFPNGVAVDSTGNVYVADSGNNLIRKVTSDGVVTTLAGSADQAGSADGTNSAALFDFPRGIASDSAGNLYVADSGNFTIRKLTSDGMVTTIGGRAGVMGGADGVGSAANFAGPNGVAVDESGFIYVADAGNNCIRKGAPMPVLNVTLSRIGVVVFWPAYFAGFVLQESPEIGNASGWSTVSNNITDEGTNKSFTVSSPTGIQYFRLTAN
jgi:sugar lactone lactonase YvrE